MSLWTSVRWRKASLRASSGAEDAVDPDRLGLADDGDGIELEGGELRHQLAGRFADDDGTP